MEDGRSKAFRGSIFNDDLGRHDPKYEETAMLELTQDHPILSETWVKGEKADEVVDSRRTAGLMGDECCLAKMIPECVNH